jgi:outer membrane immunogenic protein
MNTLRGGFLGLTATAALALAPMPADAQPTWWTGPYVGINLGGAWSHSDVNSPLFNTGAGQDYIPSVVADINAQANKSLNATDVIGGGQFGFNFVTLPFLFGGEIDLDFFNANLISNVAAAFTGFPVGPGGVPPTYTEQVRTNGLATLRTRAGLVSGPILAYVTGGLAMTNLKYSHTFTEGVFGGTSSGTESASVSHLKVGWTAGFGLEYALPHHWSIKAEYLYADFGSVSVGPTPVVFPGGPGSSFFTHKADLTTQVLRGGINFRF